MRICRLTLSFAQYGGFCCSTETQFYRIFSTRVILIIFNFNYETFSLVRSFVHSQNAFVRAAISFLVAHWEKERSGPFVLMEPLSEAFEALIRQKMWWKKFRFSCKIIMKSSKRREQSPFHLMTFAFIQKKCFINSLWRVFAWIKWQNKNLIKRKSFEENAFESCFEERHCVPLIWWKLHAAF